MYMSLIFFLHIVSGYDAYYAYQFTSYLAYLSIYSAYCFLGCPCFLAYFLAYSFAHNAYYALFCLFVEHVLHILHNALYMSYIFYPLCIFKLEKSFFCIESAISSFISVIAWFLQGPRWLCTVSYICPILSLQSFVLSQAVPGKCADNGGIARFRPH